MITRERELNEQNLESETSSGLTLAFFGEPWECGCRREWAIIEKAADVIGEQLRTGRCNIEESPELAERLNVRSIPTTIVFKDGREQERLVGLRHQATLVTHLKKHLEPET